MALRLGYAAFSPKLRLNSHPRNAVRWKPGTKGFYKPKMSASKMKWNFNVPYRREVDSLFHYPAVSRVTGKVINWYEGEPDDGYEGSRIYGEHTLELKGMPKGRTPEYMQERLRRFFAKFGPVKHCRAEPHRHDPYQCEGTAYVTFRDKNAALKALAAPLKYPASLHDKVVSMRHLDSDKQNDSDYYEKAKFWDAELVSLARGLHVQLCTDAALREGGKPLALVSRGLLERELVQTEVPEEEKPLSWARGGIPESRGGLQVTAKTRFVPAHGAVKQRFGSWQAFLAEPPFDELFRLEAVPSKEPQVKVGDDAAGRDATSEADVVVKPRLVSNVQRLRILARARMALRRRLHEEFSVWWREGKVPLPEYTQRRITWWDHTPPLPFDLQIMSRSRDRHRIFDERFLYRHQLVKARNDRRRERRSEWADERKKQLEEKKLALEARRERAHSVVSQAKCGHLLGRGLSAPRLSKGVLADATFRP